MKQLFIIAVALCIWTNSAHAGLFDDIKQGASDLTASIKDKTEEKEMTEVKLPLSAIKRNDPRIGKIEAKVVKVAMKRNARIELSCPENEHCHKIESGLREQAWKEARARSSSDFAAKAKLPEINVSRGDQYTINVYKKGIRYNEIFK